MGANDEMWCWEHQTWVLIQRTVLIDVIPIYHDMNYDQSALQHSTHFSPSTPFIHKVVSNIMPFILALVCIFFFLDIACWFLLFYRCNYVPVSSIG